MIKRKLFWWTILAILIAIGISLLGDNHGHVIVVRSPYRVQFSFNFLLFLIVCSFFILHYCLRLMGYFRKMPARWRAKKEIKTLKSKQGALMAIVQSLAKDDYKGAEKLVKKLQSKESDEDKELLKDAVALISQKNANPTASASAIEDQSSKVVSEQ
jgi:uncharacterized protein HemY